MRTRHLASLLAISTFAAAPAFAQGYWNNPVHYSTGHSQTYSPSPNQNATQNSVSNGGYHTTATTQTHRLSSNANYSARIPPTVAYGPNGKIPPEAYNATNNGSGTTQSGY